MANKGAIRFLAVLLAIVCGYYLMFTWKATSVRSDAKEFAGGDQVKYKGYLDSMRNETVLTFPAEFTYADVQRREINLGLDLRGGVNVTLEISLADIIKELAGDQSDSTFQVALKAADLAQETEQDNYVVLFAEALTNADPKARLVDYFYTTEVIEELGQEPTNDQLVDYLNEKAEAAIGQSFEVLRVRVNQFGIAQPNIQRLGNSGKIQVELPGVSDIAKVRQLLQGAAELQFWDIYYSNEIANKFYAVNNALRTAYGFDDLKKQEAELKSEELDTASTDTTSNEDDIFGDNIDEKDELANNASAEPLDILFGGNKGDFSKLAAFVGSQNNFVGEVKVTDTTKLMEYFNHPSVQLLLPRNTKFLWEHKRDDVSGLSSSSMVRLFAVKVTSADGSAPLEGEIIKDATYDFNEQGAPEVRLDMTAEGTNIWAEMTTKAAGAENDPRDNKCIAIVLDDLVYSAPVVNGPIKNGGTVITVGNDVEDAKLLATVLKAGRFPAPVRIVEEAVVGPSLGDEAIQKSAVAFVIALLAVLAYMMFYYAQAGTVANIALLVNLFFIVGVLASFPTISLTLPGLAGIVLTIGMSVDANVLIYERIREELDAGKGMKLAISDGYKHAYTAILDANVTSFVTGLILWYFGSGPILGFAKTLVIGILTSLFSAIFITRLILDRKLSKKQDISFVSKTASTWFKNSTYNFVQSRRKYYLLSGTVILAGIISMVSIGFDLGPDFVGGRTYVVRFDESVKANEISIDVQEALKGPFEGTPEVKYVSSGKNDLLIKTNYLVNSKDENAAATVELALYNGLKGFYASDITNEEFNGIDEMSKENKLGKIKSTSVGPTIADDIKASAFQSILISLIFIFLYVVARFRKWQFGLGAIVAIFHDVLIVLSLFSIGYKFLPISLEINQAFIAAILTVVGYSINDTVVVFDRIREYLSFNADKDLTPVVNKALNSTLSRTFNTSITIFVVLLMILIFGAESIQGFAFALIVGVVAGTYSSLCVATPIVIDFIKKK